MHARAGQSRARASRTRLWLGILLGISWCAGSAGWALAETSALAAHVHLVALAPSAASCGNGVLEQGERCETCPADCTVRSCLASAASYRLSVDLTTPMAEPVTAATLLVTYRTNVVGLPGKGSATSVRERVQVIASDTFTAVNDVGYGLRIALARPSELKTGRLLAVAFDACERDAPPSLEDFRCIVEGCGGPGGIVDGCACSLSVAGNAFGGAP